MTKMTHVRRIAACLLLFAAATIAAPKPAKLFFDGKSWWDHVKVIADDSMEGRETGSLGCGKRKRTRSSS
jgi:hypothetical protein